MSLAAATANSRAGTAARDMCAHADTVIEGFLCGEDTVVSDACRSPKNEVDRFVCDDKKMQEVQAGAWDLTKEALKMIVSALLGAKAGKE